ncbi:MAG TPA: class I SAM-dependent methyltransferase [Bacteroidales bacterium]|nr:class I SAM-dependent methyltransferase [Bacteroidales bacterium]
MKKHHHDVLGLALIDYQDTQRNKEIVVRSPDFEEDIIPVPWYFRREDQLPALESKALDLCRGRILDAGAGAGSHALILQDKGLDVTALDVSEGACKVMRERGLNTVVHQDLFTLTGMRFDTVLMIMNGIGLVGTVAGLKSFLGRLPLLLNPGGQVIFDSTNLIYLLQQEDGSILMNLNEVYFGEIEYQLEYEGFISEPFGWLYIDFDTLEWLAEEAGLTAELVAEGENMNYLATITYQA